MRPRTTLDDQVLLLQASLQTAKAEEGCGRREEKEEVEVSLQTAKAEEGCGKREEEEEVEVAAASRWRRRRSLDYDKAEAAFKATFDKVNRRRTRRRRRIN